LRSTAEKSPSTASRSNQTAPFFPKAGGGDFFAPAIQTKLKVGKPGDKLEQEADHMADKVMRMPAPSPLAKDDKLQRAAMPEEKLQRKEEERVQKKEEEKLQRAAMPEDKLQRKEEEKVQKKEEEIQRKGDGVPAVTSNVQSGISNKMSGGQPMDTNTRSFMESRMNADFSNVRVHSDAESGSLNNQLSARAFTYQNHVFFNRDQYQPGTSEGKHLLAHELTHTIQQGHAVQRSPQVSTTATQPHIQRLLGVPTSFSEAIDKIMNWVEGKVSLIPGWRMFTIILGTNPITGASVDRSAANILRALIEFMPFGTVITQALDNHKVFDKIGNWIEGKIKEFGMVGSMFKDALKNFLKSRSLSDLAPWNWDDVWSDAKKIFTAPITKLINFAKGVVTDIIKFVKDAILKPLAALAKGTKGYDLLCAILGEDPVTGEKVERNADTLIGGFMKLIGQEDVYENLKKGRALQRAYAWFLGALKGLWSFVKAIPGVIIDTIKSLTWQDIVTVAGAFVKIGKAFLNVASSFSKWALAQIIELLKILFSVVAPGAIPYISKAQAAFTKIIKDPIGFVGNLVKAGKLGFQNFAGNILEHLKTALIKWLVGPLGDAGVYIPKSFSLFEIIKLVLSIFGLTWQNIRGKLLKIIPEPVLVVLEKSAKILVTLVKDGPAAAWEEIKAELAELKDQIVQQITQMVTTEVVKAAVGKLVMMLNPAGAFVEAIMAIYKTVTFFIEKIQQIAAVVASFIDSISAIATGQITGAAKKVEATMASTLTVILAFLAKYIGLGDVPKKVVGIIQKLRAPVDKALDKIVGWLGGMLKKVKNAISGKNDTRTPQEKERDVELAKNEAESVLNNSKGDKEEVLKQFPTIKKKYNLTSIALENLPGGKFDVLVEINPKKKTKSVDDIFKDEAIRSKIRVEIEKEQPSFKDWVAVFPAKGVQLNIKKPNETLQKATLLNVLKSGKMQQMHLALTGALDSTINKDVSATAEKRTEKGAGFKMTGVKVDVVTDISKAASNIIRALKDTELFFVSGTDIPRHLKAAHASDLIKVNNESPISPSLYSSVAKKYNASVQAKFKGEVHHVIPLYLGGSHQIQNLIKVHGKKASDIADSAHAALHNFIDTTSIELFLKDNASPSGQASIKTTLKDTEIADKLKGHLKILIGTLKEDGSIKYKETQIKMT